MEDIVGRNASGVVHARLELLLARLDGGDQMAGGGAGLELMRGVGWAQNTGSPANRRVRGEWTDQALPGRLCRIRKFYEMPSLECHHLMGSAQEGDVWRR